MSRVAVITKSIYVTTKMLRILGMLSSFIECDEKWIYAIVIIEQLFYKPSWATLNSYVSAF